MWGIVEFIMAEIIKFDYPFPKNERIEKIWNQISSIRHDVYADELQQYDSNPEGKIQDPGKHFIVCLDGEKLIGYISLNSPNEQPFRITKYFSEEILNQTVFDMCDNKDKTTFEVRGLTISPQYRGRNLSIRLMRHALEFVVDKGGTDIVAMGHTTVLKLYENNGMTVFRNFGVKHGEISILSYANESQNHFE